MVHQMDKLSLMNSFKQPGLLHSIVHRGGKVWDILQRVPIHGGAQSQTYILNHTLRTIYTVDANQPIYRRGNQSTWRKPLKNMHTPHTLQRWCIETPSQRCKANTLNAMPPCPQNKNKNNNCCCFGVIMSHLHKIALELWYKSSTAGQHFIFKLI